jgi:3-hydroxyacyl-CoA dehydrogenase/3a,7a,12a-trihydroxy-5b-cholest-24-enoyl-CoA hydratase
VSPLVAYLCHESCPESGALLEAGGGFVSQLRWERSRGQRLPASSDGTITPEAVAEAWGRITDFDDATHPADVLEAVQPILGPT